MSRHKQNDIRILNPIAGRGYTSQKKAQQYVDDGRADYVTDDHGRRRALRFRENDPRNQRAALHVELRLTEYDIASSSGCASIDQIRHLPFAGDPLRVLMLPTKRTKRTPARSRLAC
ncbi:MAG TPA: hypothetical protein VN736_02490 [Candidatus Limnocylindrales bacterium]|nr:hypothetical protein [Candidatus Limnocylindrales bacterium]